MDYEPASEVNEFSPTSLNHIVGQRHAVEQIRVALDAAQMDSTPFPHSLLVGPPGLGKSQLSNIIAREMADRTVQMQAEQNTAAAKAHQDFVTLNSKIQTERSNLNQQFKQLEQNRRDLHRVRRSELAWSESFRFLAIVIAAVTPLFLCAYLIWAACRSTGLHQDVNELLIGELVSPTPRLIAAPNLRGIEHRSDQRHSITNTPGDNPNDVPRRTDQNGNP